VMPHFKMLPKALDASLRKCYRSYVRPSICFRFAWASLRLSRMTAAHKIKALLLYAMQIS